MLLLIFVLVKSSGMVLAKPLVRPKSGALGSAALKPPPFLSFAEAVRAVNQNLWQQSLTGHPSFRGLLASCWAFWGRLI